MSKHFSLNYKPTKCGEKWDVIAKNFGFCKGIIRRSTVSNEWRFIHLPGHPSALANSANWQ